MACTIHPGRYEDGQTKCSPGVHSPGGERKGTDPFRPGKTDRDHRSGAHARRLQNRVNRAARDKMAGR